MKRNVGLLDFSNKDLLDEIENRARNEKSAPEPLANPDFSIVLESAKELVRQAVEEGRVDEDMEHYIYEDFMTAVYGKDYWKWHNQVVG